MRLQIKRIVKYVLGGYCREEQRIESRIYKAIPEKKRMYYLFGNYESYHYIDPVLPDLRRQYRPDFPVSDKVKNLWNKIQKDTNAVALHIRMGDFVELNRSYPISYYEKSIIYHKKCNPNAHFYLLSEDLEVCKYFENREEIERIDLSGEEHQDIVEWYCLVQCRHHVLSSSTYSWWAAVLSETDQSIITIPSRELYAKYDRKEGDSTKRYQNFYRLHWKPVM